MELDVSRLVQHSVQNKLEEFQLCNHLSTHCKNFFFARVNRKIISRVFVVLGNDCGDRYEIKRDVKISAADLHSDYDT